MRALRADVGARYQHAEDLLTDILATRRELIKRPAAIVPPTPAPVAIKPSVASPVVRQPVPVRQHTKEISSGSRFCWHCRKPLPARSERCPFCGETQ
jgi:hypothetical protein